MLVNAASEGGVMVRNSVAFVLASFLVLGATSLRAQVETGTLNGYWFTVALPGGRLNTGSNWSQRPDLIDNPNLPVSQRTPQQWFATDAFVQPVGFQYGNARRGIIESPGLSTWTSRFTVIF